MNQIYFSTSITIIAARARKAIDSFLYHLDVIQCYGAICGVKCPRNSE